MIIFDRCIEKTVKYFELKEDFTRWLDTRCSFVFAIEYWCELAAIGDQDEKFINGSIITDVTSGGGSDGERGHRAEGSYGSTSGRTAVDRRVAQTFERDLGLTNRFFVEEYAFDIHAPDIFFFFPPPPFSCSSNVD